MYLPTSQKRLWVSVLLIVSLSISSFAQIQESPENSVLLKEGKYRYEINLTESVQQITICGLTPGESYDFIVNPAEFATECDFLLSPFQAGEINENELTTDIANNQLNIVAEGTCRIVSIINSNCNSEQNYPVHLTVLDQACKETQEGGFLPLVQVIYVNDALFTIEQLITQVFIAGGCFDVLNVQPIGDLCNSL